MDERSRPEAEGGGGAVGARGLLAPAATVPCALLLPLRLAFISFGNAFLCVSESCSLRKVRAVAPRQDQPPRSVQLQPRSLPLLPLVASSPSVRSQG